MQNHLTKSSKYTNVLRHADGSLNLSHYRHLAQDERANAIQALARIFVGWVKKN